jgi:hypothetical protein
MSSLLKRDDNSTAIQAFHPDPTKSTNIPISSGAFYVLSLSGWTALRFTVEEMQYVRVSMNDNSAYMPLLSGGYIVRNLTQIKFTNPGASEINVAIEGF